MKKQDLDTVNYFQNDDLAVDPYPYFDHLRAKCPVWREPHHNVVMVTGYEEAQQVYNDTDSFSSCISVTGPFPGFPLAIDGKGREEVDALIAAHRDSLPLSDQLPTLDPPAHTASRGLLMSLITPKRLADNEAFIYQLTDQTLGPLLARGHCEYNGEFAAPLAVLVIADLLGVPPEDRDAFRAVLLQNEAPDAHTTNFKVGSAGEARTHNPLEFLYERFGDYIATRREKPRNDVLTGLARAKYPDGSTPEVIDVVRVAANLFAAGQETTVRLLSSGLRILAEDQALQDRLRAHPNLLSQFVEEALRVESPVKGDFRLARCPVDVGGVKIPTGATVMVLNGAANRDPRHFEDPNTFELERRNVRQHMAFGRGIHTCPGAPLARAEARIGFQRILERTRRFWISEKHHGPAGARRYQYVANFILRGLTELHIELEPAPK